MERSGFILFVAFLAAAALTGCRGEVVPEAYRPAPDHESYGRSLEKAGLDSSALGHDWQAAAQSALENPVSVEAPFQENVYLDPSRASAVGYRFSAKRGQNVAIAVELDAEFRLFIDLYREDSRGDSFSHVASGTEEERRLELHVQSDAAYVLRLQAELLRGGTLTVSIRVGPSLAFPIEGLDTKAIFSGFGMPRDGGARRHEGVDILAPRGTEVVAPIRAYVRWVGINQRGGNVVGLTDEKNGLYLYFAHLDTQVARSGTYVEPGDVLGTVGNTGNAITTVPHLHFGVYMRNSVYRGAVDPVYYLYDPRRPMPEITADSGLLGSWGRTTADTELIDAGNSAAGLSAFTPFRIHGASSDRYRVRLPDGSAGYVSAAVVESLEEAIDIDRIEGTTALLDEPDLRASVIAEARPGDSVEILGSFERFLYVRTENGSPGWIASRRTGIM